MEYIIDALPKRKVINYEEISKVRDKIRNNIVISDNEASILLNYYVEKCLNILEDNFNEDLTNDPLINKCDLVQYVIGKLMEKDGIMVYPKESQDVFYPFCTGHSFLVVVIQNNNYCKNVNDVRPLFIKNLSGGNIIFSFCLYFK